MELLCTKTDETKYNFNTFAFPLKFIEKVYNYEITLDEAKDDQDKFEKLIIRLENYKARNNKKEEKNNVLKSVKGLFRARKDIIGLFEKGIFSFKGNVFKTKEETKKTKEEMERFINSGIALIERESKGINVCLRNIFILQQLLIWQKKYLKQKMQIKTVSL